MSRGLSRSLLAASIAALLVASARAEHVSSTAAPAILERFFALDAPAPWQCRALRHLEARNEKFEKNAWMDVWTEADATGFRYQVASEGRSGYIRKRVFLAALAGEEKMWRDGEPQRADPVGRIGLQDRHAGDAERA